MSRVDDKPYMPTSSDLANSLGKSALQTVTRHTNLKVPLDNPNRAGVALEDILIQHSSLLRDLEVDSLENLAEEMNRLRRERDAAAKKSADFENAARDMRQEVQALELKLEYAEEDRAATSARANALADANNHLSMRRLISMFGRENYSSKLGLTY